MSEQAIIPVVCPECESTNVIRDMQNGESICSRCGLVLQNNILNRGAEWRSYTSQERKMRSRVGPPTNYSNYTKGLSTIIPVDRDAFGRPLPPQVKRQMRRLRAWQLRSVLYGSQERNLSKAMNELQRLSEKLHIPTSVQEMAAVIYRKALKGELTRRRSIAALVAGALYVACRYTKTARTLKEIAEVSLRNQKEVSAAYRLIVQYLKMKMPIDDPLDYVTKIARKADISYDVEGLAINIIRDAKKKHATMGKDPSGLAAAALYVASKLKKKKKTQEKIAEAADVTHITVRNRTRDLVKALKLDLSKIISGIYVTRIN